ncbi:hypothetical protein COB21_03280 [Candidatus Aerophobetes bacterium]|uniref:Lipid II flippase n=1 Tax=Aerophobetes bacterium TaxID=2030807 RepID=A0A2A4X3W7_UNCAE|nr:MAG: hypothetical protein COB21_03280 [Candidatus Aerophobetes bacterium]
MFSRITGAFRDIAMATVFGDGASVALFIIAFRFALLLRRFFGEGPLGSAFIPRYLFEKETSLKKADTFFCDLFIKLGVFTLFIAAAIYLLIAIFTSVFPSQDSQIQMFAMIKLFLPVIVIVALYGLTIALHQSHQRFFCSQVSATLTNIMWLIGIFFSKDLPAEQALVLLTRFIVTGFIFTLLFSFFTMPRSTLLTFKSFNVLNVFKFSSSMRRLVYSFLLGIVGVGAMQINIFLDALFALYASSQGPVFLWYSQRFYQLAFSCFSLAFTSSIIPLVTQHIKAGALDKAKESFATGASRIITTTIPATVALLVMGYLFIDLFFGRGAFSAQGVSKTSLCLLFYSIGLVPTALITLLASVFYARDDFKTPLKCSLYAIGIHLFLNTCAVFILKLGPEFICLSTSISGVCNFFFLYKKADKSKVEFNLSYVRSTWMIAFFAGVPTGALIYFSYQWGLSKYAIMPVAMFTFVTLFSVGSVFTKNRDVYELFASIFPRLARRG